MPRKCFLLLVCLVLVLTSCSPGQLFGATLTPTPTLTATSSPTKTATATVTRSPTPTFTPTPPALQTLFEKVATGESLTFADLEVLPIMPWDDIPAYVASVDAKPNPFSADAPDVTVEPSGKGIAYEWLIRCVPGVSNCIVDDAFQLPNNGVVLTLRVKNNDDTAGTFLWYIDGAEGYDFQILKINRVLSYLKDRTSDAPSLPYFNIYIYTNRNGTMELYSEWIQTQEAGLIMETWQTSGNLPKTTIVFYGKTMGPDKP